MRSEERKLRVEAAAHNAGMTPSGLINALLDWWMDIPGAELPPRPSCTITPHYDEIGKLHYHHTNCQDDHEIALCEERGIKP